MTNPNTGIKYRIKPYSNGLCYEIWKQNDKDKRGYSFTGKYPGTLEHAVESTLQLMLCEPEDPTVEQILTKVPRNIGKNCQEIIKQFVDKVTIRVSKKG